MWIPEIILTIIIFVIVFFLEKFRTERNQAESENADLRRRLDEKEEYIKKLWREDNEKRKIAFKDSFLLLCSAVEHKVPRGYTIEEIAEIFYDRSFMKDVYNTSDMEPTKLQSYIDYCARYSDDIKAIEKCLTSNGLKFNYDYSLASIFLDELPLKKRTQEYLNVVVNRVQRDHPQAFLPLSNSHNSQR